MLHVFILLAQAALPAQSIGPSSPGLARPSVPVVRIETPHLTLRAALANDDATNAIRCGFDFSGASARLTLFAHGITLPTFGIRSDTERDVAFLDRRGTVIATFPRVYANAYSGGPPRPLNEDAIMTSAMLEVAPGGLLSDGILPGIILKLPRINVAAVNLAVPIPCMKQIK